MKEGFLFAATEYGFGAFVLHFWLNWSETALETVSRG
jgi:hypothetical protein